MNLNDLLQGKNIDPHQVVVFRHRPPETALNKVFPWLAEVRPDLYNAYQQIQSSAKLENVLLKMSGVGYVASFIGHEAKKALYVGLYQIGKFQRLPLKEYLNDATYKELLAFGMKSSTVNRSELIKFELAPIDFYESWKGKLIVKWPPPEKSWWRRAERNEIPVLAIHEESVLTSRMPNWDAIDLSWEELRVLPTNWKTTLSQWRGIYYIFDESDAKGYVGSAYGDNNLLGRWQSYALQGHGGNKLLRKRDPRNFRFTILQRVSPDMDSTNVINLEETWKQRLHTRKPFGLNDN